MALSFASYTGDGSNKNFAVPFPYISSEHVSVFVDGVEATFVWLNAGLVQTSVAPVNGSFVLVRRKTPNETAMVNFADASTLTESDLDLMTAQLLYIEQESADAIDSAITLDLQGRMDAKGARVINVGNPVDAQDAVTKSYFDTNVTQYRDDAQAAASEASADADTAHADRLAAETARDTAVTAAAGMVSKADINSPALTGTPTAPTAAAGTNTNQIATTAFVLANSLGAMYRTRVALAAATVPSTEKAVACLGYATAGDCDVFLMKRVSAKPLRGGVRSADRFMPDGSTDATNGGWWIYVPSAAGTDARAFGCKADWNGNDATATDNTAFLQEAIDFTALNFGMGYDSGGGSGGDVLLPRGTMMFNSNITVETGVRCLGHGTYGTVLKLAAAFDSFRNFIQLGTGSDTFTICASQTTAGAGNLLINGSLAVGGRVDFLWKQRVAVNSAGNLSALTFTVTGTGADGVTAQTDSFAGPNNNTVEGSKYWTSITQISVSGAVGTAVHVGSLPIASMASTLENLQLFSDLNNALTQRAMVYSNNTQHTGGLKKVKIFHGNRHAARLETGLGGASYFTFEDVETYGSGDAAGVASNNSSIYLNYGGLLTTIKNLVLAGPGPTLAPNQIGIEIVGGFVDGHTIHPESIATGIAIKLPNTNSGAVRLAQVLGNPNITQLIDIASTVPAGITYLSGIYVGGGPKALNNHISGGTSVNAANIIPWTVY
jgi:hypothetical protein